MRNYFEALLRGLDDSRGIDSGTLANRPPAREPGAVYKATDQSPVQYFVCDGDEWVELELLVSKLGTASNKVGEIHAVDAHSEALTAEDLEHDPRTESSNVVSRPVLSTGHIDLYVDPSSGDDNSEGSSINPLKTIQEAFDRLPHSIQHDCRINLRDGTYSESSNASIASGTHIVNFQKGLNGTSEVLAITGDTTTPSNVTIDGPDYINIAFRGGVPYRTVLEGARFNCKIQNYAGNISIRDAELDGDADVATNAVIDGYAGFVLVRNSTFGANATPTHAAYANQGQRIRIENCDGYVTGNIFEEENGGQVFYNTDNEITGEFPSTYLADDFRDNRLTGRVSESHPWKRIRPDWTTSSGSPSVDSGTLTFPAGDTTPQIVRTDTAMYAGTWEFDFQFNSDPTSASFNFYILFEGGENYLNFQVRNDGNIKLLKKEAGAFADVVTGTWGDDTSQHTAKITASYDSINDTMDYELFVDGTSQGTGSDSFKPTNPTLRLVNSTNAQIDIDTIVLH